MMVNLIEWKQGDAPPESGWYLAAVNMYEEHPCHVITLMLWYDPPSARKWYFWYGVGGEKGIEYDANNALNGEDGNRYAAIKAWAEVPEYKIGADKST